MIIEPSPSPVFSTTFFSGTFSRFTCRYIFFFSFSRSLSRQACPEPSRRNAKHAMKNPYLSLQTLTPLRLCARYFFSDSDLSRQVAKAQSLYNRRRNPINLFSELGVLCAFARDNS